MGGFFTVTEGPQKGNKGDVRKKKGKMELDQKGLHGFVFRFILR